jgi:hypothetical protein
LRGLLTAVIIVAVLLLVIVFRSQLGESGGGIGRFLADHIPDKFGQQAAVVVFLILTALITVAFSHAGRYTAYGIAMGIVPLLWFVFWEGFPLLGLHPTWTSSLGLGSEHLDPVRVITWAVVADVLITLIFVPLELRENMLRRRHRLGEDEEERK